MSELKIESGLIFFYYNDVVNAGKFYKEVMGFELTKSRGDFERIFKVKPNMYLGLFLGGRGYHNVSPTKPVMFTILVPDNKDVENWFEHFKRLGIETIDKSPRTRKDGGKVFLLNDPEGYVIEIQTSL